MLPLQARVDLGAMAMKGYSAFPKAPALLEPYHQIVYCHIQDTPWGGLTPLWRCSQCILQPQLTGQKREPLAKVANFTLLTDLYTFILIHCSITVF